MTFTEDDIEVLFYLQRYGFLTIKQAIRILDKGRSYQNIARRLKSMADQGYLGAFGGHRIGFANVPKVYFLREQGYGVLVENRFEAEYIGEFRKRKKPGWSPQTMHRVNLVEVLLALEIGIRSIDFLDIARVFLEYNRRTMGSRVVCETTDFLDSGIDTNTRIVPDAAFVVRSSKTEAKMLFFVELDMGTEGIVSRIEANADRSLVNKFEKYEYYLGGQKYADKYREWGDFDCFILLFVTTTAARVDNIRGKLKGLDEDFDEYFLFNTIESVKDNFFRKDWKSRSISDNTLYSVLS